MKSIFAYLIPAGATWMLVNYDLVPDKLIVPVAILTMIITSILMVLEAGWSFYLRQGRTEKCRKLWAQMEKDLELLEKKTSVWVVLLLLVLSVLFSEYTFTTILFALGTVYALIQYLGYGSKYNDNFQDPSGFV